MFLNMCKHNKINTHTHKKNCVLILLCLHMFRNINFSKHFKKMK